MLKLYLSVRIIIYNVFICQIIATFSAPPQCDPRGAFLTYHDNLTKFPGKLKIM